MRQGMNPDLYREEWQWQEGDVTVTRSCQWSGPGCHQGCNVLFYTKDNKLVKIEGDPRSPVNDGRLCMRCLAMVEAVNHPDRILHPLRRVGERGENKWEQITMDDAYAIIAEKAREVTEEYGPKSIVTGIGTGRNATWQTSSLAFAGFKTPNDTAGMLSGDCCYTPRLQAMNAIFGSDFIADCAQLSAERFDDPEYRRPDVILNWACNPIVSNADGFFGHWIVDCMQHGSRLMVVDPRVTWMAAHADIFLQLRPGTDAAVALGICNIMIQEKLYDEDFCEKWVYGMEALAERAALYTPEVVEKISWVPAEKIVEAARYLGQAGTVALQWGLPLDETKWAVGASLAVAAVEVLTGSIDVPGGFVNVKYGHVQSDIRENICKGMGKQVREGRLGDGKYALRTVGFGPHSMGDDILLAMETGEPYPIKMGFLCSTNTFINMAGESKRVYEAWQNVPFVVVCDLFMTPTAVGCADIVLPIAMGCERWGIRAWFTPLRAINKILQAGDARGDEQIMLELGQILNPDMFFWDTVPEMNEYVMKNLSSMPFDITWDELQEKTLVYPKFKYRKYETGDMRFDHQPGFNTTTGRIELYCTMYDSAGIDPLPSFKEPTCSPISHPEEAAEYPFVLTTGRRSWEFFHSEHRQLKSMREFHPWPLCEINDQDAAALGIKDGDWVYLENQFGKCKQKAMVTPGQLKGVIMAEHGWWFPERSGKLADGLFGAFDSNINCLTVQNDMATAGYGSSYKTQVCKVYKVTDGTEPKGDRPENVGRDQFEIVEK